MGYAIPPYAGPKSMARMVSVLESVREEFHAAVENLFVYPSEAAAVGLLSCDFLLAPPAGVDFARHFPLQEFPRFAELVMESISCGVPLELNAATCPDYLKDSYELGEGIGEYGRKLLDKIPALQEQFKRRGITIAFDLVVADCDAVDPFLRSKMFLPIERFLSKTRQTQGAIVDEVQRLGLGEVVTVDSMLSRCEERGINYVGEQIKFAEQVLAKSDGKIGKVKAGLIKERTDNGEYQQLGLPAEEYEIAAAYELAGYAVYGALVGPDAVVCSMASLSAVAGLNMLKNDRLQVSPTMYLYEKKQKMRELFID